MIASPAKLQVMCGLEALFSPIFGCQNDLLRPACASTVFAMCRDLMLASTGKCLPECGLNHISWSPRPWRTLLQPASRSFRFRSLVKPATIPPAGLSLADLTSSSAESHRQQADETGAGSIRTTRARVQGLYAPSLVPTLLPLQVQEHQCLRYTKLQPLHPTKFPQNRYVPCHRYHHTRLIRIMPCRGCT